MLSNSALIVAAVEVLENAIQLIRAKFPNDAQSEVIEFAKKTFGELNLAGETISAERILSCYQQQHITKTP